MRPRKNIKMLSIIWIYFNWYSTILHSNGIDVNSFEFVEEEGQFELEFEMTVLTNVPFINELICPNGLF